MTLLPQTLRLDLRWVGPDDLDFIFAMQSNPITMRYIRPAETDRSVVVARLDKYLNYAADNPGLGVLIATERALGVTIGYAVVRHIDFMAGNDLEIGYGLMPAYWNKGYATEIAHALAAYTFAQWDVDHVVAFTDPANQSSNHVLQKCGFTPVGSQTTEGIESIRWVLQRPASYMNQ